MGINGQWNVIVGHAFSTPVHDCLIPTTARSHTQKREEPVIVDQSRNIAVGTDSCLVGDRLAGSHLQAKRFKLDFIMDWGI